MAFRTWPEFSKVRHRGVEKISWVFTFAAAYNLVRMRNLLARPVGAA
jgi:hypothetical protein